MLYRLEYAEVYNEDHWFLPEYRNTILDWLDDNILGHRSCIFVAGEDLSRHTGLKSEVRAFIPVDVILRSIIFNSRRLFRHSGRCKMYVDCNIKPVTEFRYFLWKLFGRPHSDHVVFLDLQEVDQVRFMTAMQRLNKEDRTSYDWEEDVYNY